MTTVRVSDLLFAEVMPTQKLKIAKYLKNGYHIILLFFVIVSLYLNSLLYF